MLLFDIALLLGPYLLILGIGGLVSDHIAQRPWLNRFINNLPMMEGKAR